MFNVQRSVNVNVHRSPVTFWNLYKLRGLLPTPFRTMTMFHPYTGATNMADKVIFVPNALLLRINYYQ